MLIAAVRRASTKRLLGFFWTAERETLDATIYDLWEQVGFARIDLVDDPHEFEWVRLPNDGGALYFPRGCERDVQPLKDFCEARAAAIEADAEELPDDPMIGSLKVTAECADELSSEDERGWQAFPRMERTIIGEMMRKSALKAFGPSDKGRPVS